MKQSLAYDLPVRIFHWFFALLFLASFSIANFIDDDSSLYSYHMLSGILMVFLVVLRVLWGVFGSKTSRFSSFKLNPSELFSYFSSINSSKAKKYLGHNPASSYAMIFMMLLAIGLASSGFAMCLGIRKHFFEEIHEVLAYGFLAIVLSHVLGVLFHQLKHHDGMVVTMISGKKDKVEGTTEIESGHPLVAIIFLILVIGMGSYLLRNFNQNKRELSILGNQIQLGEIEEKGKGEHNKNEEDDD